MSSRILVHFKHLKIAHTKIHCTQTILDMKLTMHAQSPSMARLVQVTYIFYGVHASYWHALRVQEHVET